MFLTYKTLLRTAVRSGSLSQVIRSCCTKSKGGWELPKPMEKTAPQRFLATARPHESLTSIPVKKRLVRKKKVLDDEASAPGVFNVVAFSTSEEYDLEALIQGLKNEDLYEPHSISNESDVIHACAKYTVGKEPREIFFFRDGGLVLWNVSDMESSNVLNFVRKFEQDSYSERWVQSESEIMTYKYHIDEEKASCLDKEGNFVLSLNPETENLTLIKYTFSNVMFLSVKLGIWESSLERYIEEIEGVTQDLKRGKKIKMTREAALQKHGELFALRHYLNLSSDVLDTPDFYWENEQLENLYNQVCVYFSINKRTKTKVNSDPQDIITSYFQPATKRATELLNQSKIGVDPRKVFNTWRGHTHFPDFARKNRTRSTESLSLDSPSRNAVGKSLNGHWLTSGTNSPFNSDSLKKPFRLEALPGIGRSGKRGATLNTMELL